MRRSATLWGPLRVAGLVTGIVAVLYVLIAGGVLYWFVHSLNAGVDDEILYQLQLNVARVAHNGPVRVPPNGSVGPMVIWYVNPQGGVQVGGAMGAAGFAPPATHITGPTEIDLGGEPFRVAGAPVLNGWLVVGEDVSPINRVATIIGLAETGVGIPVLGVTFAAAFLSGRRETVRVERARERQLAFTGDASHELRTPLQVIEAETSLALLRERPAEAYKDTIRRISDESRRLRTIVEDLLWLARFEGQPAAPPSKVLDLHDVGQTAVERFRAVAGGRSISLHLERLSDDPALVSAPPDWLERLAGVLLDNACRYVPDGGEVRLVTGVREGRPLLAVEDSGPGIAAEQLARIFDRFHRASSKPGGAGLGLSIADSVVRGTGGRWQVGRSLALGGAHFEVSWPLARGPRPLEQAAGAAQAPPA